MYAASKFSHIHAYIYVCMQRANSRTYMHTYTYVCSEQILVYTCIYIRMYAASKFSNVTSMGTMYKNYAYVYTYMYVHTCLCAGLDAVEEEDIYRYTHIHICMYTRMYAACKFSNVISIVIVHNSYTGTLIFQNVFFFAYQPRPHPLHAPPRI